MKTAEKIAITLTLIAVFALPIFINVSFDSSVNELSQLEVQSSTHVGKYYVTECIELSTGREVIVETLGEYSYGDTIALEDISYLSSYYN